MIIRKETIADIDAITKVTIAAFKNNAVSNQTEQYIINALRDVDAFTLSFVTEIDGRIVGQGCVLVGHPNYYKRLGFQNFPELVHEGVPQEVFFALPFTEKVPKGIVEFHKGFLATG